MIIKCYCSLSTIESVVVWGWRGLLAKTHRLVNRKFSGLTEVDRF